MDFELTQEQEELRDGARTFLLQACPPAVVRRSFDAEPGQLDPRSSELWQEMVRLDWPALTVPERFGGMGLGFVELTLVVEEVGRAVAPSPFIATLTQFAPMVREAGPSEQAGKLLQSVAEGGSTGTLAMAEASGRWEPEAVTATARPAGRGWALAGRKSYVLDGTTADEIAVVARAEGTAGTDGLGVFVLPGPSVPARALRVSDPSQPLAELDLDGLEVPPERVLIEPGDPRASRAVARAVQEGTAAMAASGIGTCGAIFDRTLQYAKDREQYGRPIGSFQALKHRLVDMYLAVERARSLSYLAALTISEEDDRREISASMAKVGAGECQRAVVQEGLQMHGGIGFTWEHDLHLYLKRAKSTDFLFGSSLTHRASVARLLGLAA